MTAKPALRQEALARRDALTVDQRRAASALIAERCAPIVSAAHPKCLAAYVAMRSECDPEPIVGRAVAAGTAVALPAMVEGAIVFRRHHPGAPLVPATFGTVEPAADAPPAVPDCVIVPVVGFDRTGMRLGYGKGHYDRALATLRRGGAGVTLVGVAFSVQEVGAIPHEAHDVRLDWIVTEKEALDCRARAGEES